MESLDEPRGERSASNLVKSSSVTWCREVSDAQELLLELLKAGGSGVQPKWLVDLKGQRIQVLCL